MKTLPSAENSAQLTVLNELFTNLSAPPDLSKEEAGTPLSHYLWIIRRNRWRILAFVALIVAGTFVVSKRLTPMYEATTTIDIDRQLPATVVGEDSERASMNDADQFLSTQMKLIQSDAVLRPVAETYKLLELEQQYSSKQDNSDAAAAAPVMLKKLHVIRPPNTYLLLISYRSPNPVLSANVANAIAKSYVQHTYYIRYQSSNALSEYMEKQLEEVRAKMERSSTALASFERELNVVNPEEKTSILSSRLLQLNTDYTNAQSERVKKQAAYESVKNGSMEAAQISEQGEALRRLSERLTDAQEKFAEVSSHYGSAHPEYKKAAAQLDQIRQTIEETREKTGQRVQLEYEEALNRENMMRKQVAETKTEFDSMNARSFEYQAAKREAEADRKLYEELVSKIKEASINTSFQNSAIRIADYARPPYRAFFPKTSLNCLIAALAALLVAFVTAVVSDVLDKTVRRADFITRELKTVLLGTLPVAKSWNPRSETFFDDKSALPAGRKRSSLSEFEEAVRTLHTSLLIGDLDRTMKSVLITSCSSNEGKSTTAAYLAIAHSKLGRKTLLIDGDLRRPVLHKRLRVNGIVGLANVLDGELDWKEVIQKPSGYEYLDIMPAGPASGRAPELVGRSFPKLIAEASREYDLIVLDGPPSSGFAEPLHMATTVDGVVVVARAGQTQNQPLAALISTLNRLRARVLGVVLNQVSKDVSDDSYYAYSTYGSYTKYRQVEG